MKKLLITTSSFGEYSQAPIELLKRAGYEVVFNPYKRKLKPEESLKLYAEDIEGIIAGTEDITGDLLEKACGLKVISRCGTGMDNIDIEAAKRKGIKLYNTPGGPTIAVAELTIGLILGLLRHLPVYDSAVRNGKWNKSMGNLLYNKKVGIIGFGRIGQKVAAMLSVFNTELAYCDIVSKTTPIKCVKKNMREILEWADIITLHLSVTKENTLLLGANELRAMKKGSWLVNVSRGGIIDEAALYECIKDGHLAGAALDVFENEPYSGRLKELDNVILTPHIGSYAKEARVLMETQAAENLIKGLKQKGEI